MSDASAIPPDSVEFSSRSTIGGGGGGGGDDDSVSVDVTRRAPSGDRAT